MALDKILDQIRAKAEAEAAEIKAQANAKAEEIINEAKSLGNKAASDIAAKSQTEVAGFESRTQSSIDLNRRQSLLSARQELISDVLNKAYEKLTGLDGDKYFEVIEKLLKTNVQSGNGKISFSKKDMERLPAGFEGKIKEIAKAAGGDLEIADASSDIENGFVLKYGDIEENCSLRAIFDARKDELTDLVNGILL